MPWYRSGTVSISSGQTTVIGTGTNFALNARVGDAFQGPDGRWYEVANIGSESVLGILPAYQGATVSAGSYGLAPMQGYVKEAADRLAQLVNQFGATLALFGGATDAATLRSNIGAASRGANNDITSLSALSTAIAIAQGGTGATTAPGARSALGLKSAAVADILGLVSQSGGSPTGAILERGSNANGEYVKFADGTMICAGLKDLGSQTFVAIGSIFYTGAFSAISFPAAFVGIPKTSIGIISSSGLAWASQGSSFATTTATPAFYVMNPSGSTNSLTAVYTAIGRWFP